MRRRRRRSTRCARIRSGAACSTRPPRRGVYVSFDDGAQLAVAAAQPAGLVRPRSRSSKTTTSRWRRTAAASGFSTTSRRCGRSTPTTAARDAVLFTPAAAWRVRWNTSTDMPWPKDEPTLPEPAGRHADQLLPEAAAARSGDARGADARTAGSCGATRAPIVLTPVPDADDGGCAALTGIVRRSALSAAAGMHRFHWDLRYQPARRRRRRRGGGPSIQAIPYNSAPAPTTPLVAPGTLHGPASR